MERASLTSELRWLTAHNRARYRSPIFDVRVRREGLLGGDVTISGTVLLPSQRTEIERIARRYADGSCRFEIDVLASASVAAKTAVADAAVVDVFDSALPDAQLSTQITPADPPFEVLAHQRGRLLVRLDDHTFGWIDDSHVRFRERTTGSSLTVGAGRAVATTVDVRDALDEALSYLGVPYAMGGCTRQSIDCSALIQRSFRTAFGVVLPRNTRDQLVRGRTVAPFEAQVGDVVFLDGPRGHHVGMLLGQGRVLHASYAKHRVAIDTLTELRQKLRFIGIRRFVEPR